MLLLVEAVAASNTCNNKPYLEYEDNDIIIIAFSPQRGSITAPTLRQHNTCLHTTNNTSCNNNIIIVQDTTPPLQTNQQQNKPRLTQSRYHGKLRLHRQYKNSVLQMLEVGNVSNV